MALKMEFDEVISQGNKIAAHSEDVTELQQWLNDVVNNQLPSIWMGSGYEGFQTRVEALKPSFDAMRQLIEDIGNGVVANANQYREFDRMAGQANSGN